MNLITSIYRYIFRFFHFFYYSPFIACFQCLYIFSLCLDVYDTCVFLKFSIDRLIIFIVYIFIYKWIISNKKIESDEIYDLYINTRYYITFSKKEKEFAIIKHKKDPKGWIIETQEGFNIWMKLCYKEQAIDNLLCAREYLKESLFSKDYLPLDLFKEIIKIVEKN
jgi:hypothetical protein